MKKKIVLFVAACSTLLLIILVTKVVVSNFNQSISSPDVQEFIKSEEMSLTNEDLQDPSTVEFVLQSKTAKEKLKKINDEIRRDSDFEVLLDNGDGIMAYTNAKDVDRERFLRKVEKIEAQQSVISSNKVSKLDGFMENKINDHLTIYKPLLSGNDILKYSGTNVIQWTKDKSKYEKWDKLTGVNDVFTIGYVSVDNINTDVTVGAAEENIIGSNGSAASKWTVSNTTAIQTITWPDSEAYFHYGKTFGLFTVQTKEITNYTHQSFAIANVGGEHIMVNTQASTTF